MNLINFLSTGSGEPGGSFGRNFMIPLDGIEFDTVFDGIRQVLPVILPALIGFIAFRKAWSFVKGAIKGA